MRLFLFELTESLRIAGQQIRANRLRSFLTALGVIIGILAITLMGTAIFAIDAGVNRSLAVIGDDLLYVTKWPWRDVDDWWNFRNRPQIRTTYAEEINAAIARNPRSALKLAVPADSVFATIFRGDCAVRGIYTFGTTSDLPLISKTELREGRFFNEVESRGGRNVTVLGFDVAEALFPGVSPLGQTVRIRDQDFTVIGVAERQGSFLGLWSWDSNVALPLAALRRVFTRNTEGAEIRVQIDRARADEARLELRCLVRRIRGVPPEKPDNFEVNTQEGIKAQLDPIRNSLAAAGLLITGLSLFVGAIGIMNITYVSVKERTREIGTRKALGARRRTILLQFLVEAVAIAGVGGIAGLLLSVGLTTIVQLVAPSLPIAFSPLLVVFSLVVSVLVGAFSGFAPAWSASRLDPVEALRYE